MLVREAGSCKGFDLQVGGLGSFPNARQPRVLWLGLHATAALISTQQTIEAGAVRLGYQKEERPFSPHLTIGRVKQGLPAREQEKITLTLNTVQLGNIATARVDSIHLFKSDLQPGGPIYTKLCTAKLMTASVPEASP
jgi:2'-5' RNA ligase